MKEMLHLEGTPVWGREIATAVDRHSSTTFLIPPLALMEQAGRAVATVILNKILTFPKLSHQILVLAGPGNNGGDALVAARYLSEAGFKPVILSVLARGGEKRSSSCVLQVQILQKLGIELGEFKPGSITAWREKNPLSHIWIIDGIFGLGGRAVFEEDSNFSLALKEAQKLKDSTCVAIDIPSGLEADDGATTEALLPAQITVTFGALKPVHVLAPARDFCGELIVKDIGFPRAAAQKALAECPPLLQIPDTEKLLRQNPWAKLPPSCHKYDRGHILVIGGSPGKTGAPLLSALSALRCGAGWATVAMPQLAFDTLRGDVPREVVFESLFQSDVGQQDKIDATSLESFLKKSRVKAIVIGPGTMGSPLDSQVLECLGTFCRSGGFVVFDAGACHGLVTLLQGLKEPSKLIHAWVMTPHPGEWLKLGLVDPTPPLRPKPHREISALAARLGIAMLFKGATPVLFTGDKDTPAWVQTEGSKALARAGSGDLLSGLIGAHGAMGLPSQAATLRAYGIMAKAAHNAAQKVGYDAVLAQDILMEIGMSSEVNWH